MPVIQVNHCAFNYELGAAGGPLLVLLHEAGGNLESWDALLPALAAAPHQVLRYDQRGFGRSGRARELSLASMVEDLHALLAVLSPVDSLVALVGTAIGGSIALAYAAQFPGQVRAVVAASPVTCPPPPQARPWLEQRALLLEREGMHAIADASLERSWPPALRTDAGRFERYRARFLANDAISFAALTRAYAQVDLRPCYANVHCPALIIGCSADDIIPPAQCASAAAALPHGRYLELDAAHYVAVQAPDRLAPAVLEFLA